MKMKPVFLFLLPFLLASCSTQQWAVRMSAPLIAGQYAAINEEIDPELAQRALPASLKMLEGMVRVDPENRSLLLTLAEGYCSYAFSFVEDEDPGRASSLYLRGRDYALRALETAGVAPGLLVLKPDDYAAQLKAIDREQLPGLFWLGQCWSGWLMLNLDDLEAFVVLPRVETTLKRVLEWDPSYHYAAPHLFFGGFYGARPKMLGGDPDKSRQHFERALELTGRRYLMTQVLYARTLAVQTQDRKLFTELLMEVEQAPADLLPEQRLANQVAKLKAKKLLEAADDLF